MFSKETDKRSGHETEEAFRGLLVISAARLWLVLTRWRRHDANGAVVENSLYSFIDTESEECCEAFLKMG